MKPLERVALVLLLLFAGCCAGPQRQPHGSAAEALYDACRSQCSIEAAQPIDPFVLVTAGHVYCFCHAPDAAPEKVNEWMVRGAGLEPTFAGSEPAVLPLDDPRSGGIGAAGFEPAFRGSKPRVLPLDEAPALLSLGLLLARRHAGPLAHLHEGRQ